MFHILKIKRSCSLFVKYGRFKTKNAYVSKSWKEGAESHLSGRNEFEDLDRSTLEVKSVNPRTDFFLKSSSLKHSLILVAGLLVLFSKVDKH